MEIFNTNFGMDSEQLKDLLPGSRFLDKAYDPALMGIDSCTGAAIYNSMAIIDIMMEQLIQNGNAFNSEDWQVKYEKDLIDLSSFCGIENNDGKIPPVLFLKLASIGYENIYNVISKVSQAV